MCSSVCSPVCAASPRPSPEGGFGFLANVCARCVRLGGPNMHYQTVVFLNISMSLQDPGLDESPECLSLT